jgi:hypothetical protein
MSHDVFISYSSQDQRIAETICYKLESDGIRCWIAPRDIAPKEQYFDGLTIAIDSCKIFIVIISQNANSAPHIQSEVEQAFSKNKIIIPFLIENIALSNNLTYFISSRQWFDATMPPIEKHIMSLMTIVRSLLEGGKNAFINSNENSDGKRIKDNKIFISTQVEDVLSYRGDVIILNYSGQPYGLENKIIEKIQNFDPDALKRFQSSADHILIPSNQVIGARYVLFNKIKSIRYNHDEIRENIYRSLKNLSGETIQFEELIITLQGIYLAKITDIEYINSEIEGILDAVDKKMFPYQIKRITIVDKSQEKCGHITAQLSKIFPQGYIDLNKVPEIRKSISEGFQEIAYEKCNKTSKYDVFISAKNLNLDGKRTKDSLMAEQLHNFLTDKGFRVFWSNISLEKLGIAAYKEAIDNALDCAKILVTVGTSKENLESRWVKYEWDSFFNDILSGVKPEGRVFVYIINIKIQDLPRALRQTQCFEHEPEAFNRISRFIGNALGKET